MKYKMKATLPLITAPVVTVHRYRGDFTIWAMAFRARSFSGSFPLPVAVDDDDDDDDMRW